MAAVLTKNEIGVREIGTTVTLPSHPTGRLMYYLNCMCSVLDLNDTQNIARLVNYPEYYVLTEEEVDKVIALCCVFQPDNVVGKVIFQNEVMCGDSSNNFYEVSAVQHNLLVSDSLLIGGQRRHVTKIMYFKPEWLVANWYLPMGAYKDRINRLASGGEPRAIQGASRNTYDPPTSYNHARRAHSSSCCAIL